MKKILFVLDFRPNELDVRIKEETVFHMSIRHKKTGKVVAASGENKFALECELLEKLRQRVGERPSKKLELEIDNG